MISVAGAAIGAGIGLIGVSVVDKTKKDQENAYREGYEAGQQPSWLTTGRWCKVQEWGEAE